MERLAAVSQIDLGDNFSRFLEALRQRHDFFHSVGCRLADHGLETVEAEECTATEAAAIFARLRRGDRLDPSETAKFRSAVLYELAIWNAEKGWTQQFHIGALRNNNTRLYRLLGPDTGFDSIGDLSVAGPLSRFLDRLDRNNHLAKSILYNLNPAQNDVMATMIGNFQDGSVPGKMQYGSGWWCPRSEGRYRASTQFRYRTWDC